MPVFHRLAALAAAIALLAPVTAHALDNDSVAGSEPIALTACNGSEDDTIKPVPCEKEGYDALVAAIDTAFAATLAKTPANIKPLLRRDEVWFDEIILAAGDDGLPEDFADTLRQRAAVLTDIAGGFGRPETASDEEICADPDLADNDQRLNKAWKALLPRLDDVTRRALMEDQRGWVHAQAWQYPEFLHPTWEKLTSFMHYTANGRDKLDQLQRERIALFEGFDDKRTGIVGVWIAHNAIINVTADKDGISAKGWKWQQGKWKDGCDYDMSGDMIGGAFRSALAGNNPDTLERDHATLIVNRRDDAFARARKPGTDQDEWKCKRLPSNSSTARLFPARPSPDIGNFDDIR